MAQAKSTKSPRQTPVQLSAPVHAELCRMANDISVRENRRVSLREMVERALVVVYPTVAAIMFTPSANASTSEATAMAPTPPSQPTQYLSHGIPRDVEADLEAMAAIVNALYTSDDPVMQTSMIEALSGQTIQGTYGQTLSLKELAYFLRSAEPEHSTGELVELVRWYEAGKAGE